MWWKFKFIHHVDISTVEWVLLVGAQVERVAYRAMPVSHSCVA